MTLDALVLIVSQLDEAIKALEKSIELNSERAQPMSWLALLYLKQEQYSHAQSLATKALELRPHNRLANYVYVPGRRRLGAHH